ncbi:hypothetical protein JCM10213_005188 [Rhodosporidiobolus nylandii]
MSDADYTAAALADMLKQQAAQQRSDPNATPLDVDDALAHGASLKGKVVVVTGAASGFGKEYSKKAASYGAKVVLSDMRLTAVQTVVDEITKAGGDATGVECNVCNWEEQVKMFRHAVSTYGVVDVVAANAGIAEAGGRLLDLSAGADGEPEKPGMATLDVNVVGASYTLKLAFFHLKNNPATDKSIIILGSMASFFGLPGAPLYSTSKHAVLGLMRSTAYDAAVYGIRLNIVNPWFVKTSIFGAVPLLLLAGIPLATVPDVVAAMVAASCKPDSHGSAFCVDFKGILEVPYSGHAAGEGTYYKVFADRASGLIGWGKWAADSVAAIVVGIKRRSLR